jgi:hypothetical protein
MTTKDKAIVPTSADYAMGYAAGFNDACNPPAPDCRTCENYLPSGDEYGFKCTSRCTAGELYKPSRPVVLWSK